MKSLFKIAAMLISIPLLYFGIVFYSAIPFHNVTLNSFANGLFSIRTHLFAEVIDRQKNIGVLIGNGNHCDFYAGIVLKTKQSEKSIENYYTSQYRGNSEIKIIDLDKHRESPTCGVSDIRKNCEIAVSHQHTISQLDDVQSLYLVYIFEAGMTSRLGDVRCS